jgi:phosphorylcholine metabolism protein LicD
MKDVHDIFALYNIEYWIQGGTLLGAIRHQGLMWWDDDLDINIDSYHIATIFQLKPVFEKLGYQLLIYHNLMIKIYKDREYWIDIFPTQHHESNTQVA